MERDEGKEGVGEEEMEKKEARGERRWGGGQPNTNTQSHTHTHARTHQAVSSARGSSLKRKSACS